MAQLTSGPRLPLAFLPQASIRPFIGLDYIILDDVRYFWAPVAGAAVRSQILPATGIEIGADIRDRRYRDSNKRPNNSDQDGLVASLSAQVTQQLFSFMQVSAAVAYSDEQSRAGFQANEEIAFTLGAAVVFPGPIEFTPAPWTLSANATRGFAYYDSADPAIAPNTVREDIDWRANATLAVPLTESLGLIVSGGLFRRESNLQLYAYRNTFGSVGASWRF